MQSSHSLVIRNILLLEDDPVARRLLEYEFEGQLFNVIAVSEADTAIERLSQKDAHFEIGIFDMRVPPRSGEIAKRGEGLRVVEQARAKFPGMTLIAITSMDISEIGDKMASLGVEVFSRPISVSDVHRFVSSRLGD